VGKESSRFGRPPKRSRIRNPGKLVCFRRNVLAGVGHARAAEMFGRTRVPTIKLEHLTEAQAKAFMIAENRLAEISSWEEGLLAEMLKGLASVELDFSLEATGFEIGEIDLRIESSEEDSGAPKVPSPNPKICGCSAIIGSTAADATPVPRDNRHDVRPQPMIAESAASLRSAARALAPSGHAIS
jgi:hypothetical protein